jgi:hypothetical protein
VVLSCAGDAAEADVERRIGDSLARSVRVPAVKCVLVQRSLSYNALGKTKTSEEIARRHIPGKALRALGYWHSVLHMPGGSAFDVWLRGTVTEPWWTKHPQKAEHPGATANADDGLDRDAETGSLAGRETSGSRR